MIRVTAFAFLLLFLCIPASALTIVSDGSSDYSIVIPDGAIPSVKTAAEELATHIEKMSGAKLPIVSDSEFTGRHAILLGDNRHLKKLDVHPNWKQLGKEGYLLRVVDNCLIIAGGSPRGTLYGVYWLLEKHLGCRWFTPDTTVIPRRITVTVPDLDFTGKPLFEYREPWMYIGGRHQSYWWRDNFSQEYVARTRNSGYRLSSAMMDQRYGGSFKMPHYGHNLGVLVSAEKYGQTHPEYFALQPNGKRITTGPAGYLSLCLTHPDVLRIASETMLEWMRASPDADMFFVAQSDSGEIKTCQCERCLAVSKKYSGLHSGQNIEFVNEIARRVEKEFPDTLIGTFAYSNTYRAPANIKAHKNVVVWFCPITRCFCHPINRGLINKGFYRYIKELTTWSRIASKVYVYDYSCRPQTATPPYDLLNLPETVRTYRRLGVKGIFVDALPDLQVGFGFLRYWLMSQLFNDPDFNFHEGMNEFLEAYYGAASVHIQQFIELVSDPKMYEPEPGDKASIWYPQGSPQWQDLRNNCVLGNLPGSRRLSCKTIEKAYLLFESARKAVADDAKALQHVLSARMVLQSSMLEYLPADDPRLEEEAVSFLNLAKELKMRSIRETPLEEYRMNLSRRLDVKITP